MSPSRRLSSLDIGRGFVSVLALSIFALVGFHFLRSSREAPGARLYEQIVSLQLLNGQLSGGKTDFATTTFVNNTRYEGHVRTNLPPLPNYLSIVFFNYSERLPPYMKYQCFSYPKEEIIYCDARFLDSFPDAAPIQLNESDPGAPSVLFLWAIGHEIGHVVLRHSRPGVINVSGGPIYDAWHRWSAGEKLVPLKSLADLVSLGNAQENEADDFAIKQLKLNQTRALQMAMTLTDTALWLEDKYRNAARAEHIVPTLYISRLAHPPLLMRILALSKEMEKTFVAYRQLPYISSDDILFNVSAVSPKVVDPTLLFDGFYRHITDASIDANDLHDLALYAFFMYGPPDYYLIRDAFCVQANQQTDASGLCRKRDRGDRTTEAFSKPCDDRDDNLLWGCAREHVAAFLTCLTPSNSPTHDRCPAPVLASAVRQQLEQLDGHKFSGVTKEWTALAHAEVFIQSYVAGQKTEVSVEDYAEYLLGKWGPALTLRVVERLIGEYTLNHEADATKLAVFHSAARDLARKENATDDAVRHGVEAIRFAEKLSSPDAKSMQAAARTELARLYLREQNRIPSLGFDAYKTYVAKAIPLFQQSLSLRQQTLAESEASQNEQAISISVQQLSIASNDVVYSLVQASQCEAALPFTGAVEQLAPRLGKDVKLVALSLENVAAANVCAHSGDAAHAVDAATRAVAIREQFKETPDDHRRLMVAYFTLWEAAQRNGNMTVCAEAVGKFSRLYEAITGHHVDPSFSTPIDGKLVSIENCLAAHEHGESR